MEKLWNIINFSWIASFPLLGPTCAYFGYSTSAWFWVSILCRHWLGLNSLWRSCRLAPRVSWSKRNSGPYFKCIIFSSIIVCIKELLEPLNKFKIVLKPAFDQAIHGYNLWWLGTGVEVLQSLPYRTLSTLSFLKATCRILKFCIYSCSSKVENFTFFKAMEPLKWND